jgi:copper chaperone CopZ
VAVVDIIVNNDMACRGCANVINRVVSGNGGSGGSVTMVLGVV